MNSNNNDNHVDHVDGLIKEPKLRVNVEYDTHETEHHKVLYPHGSHMLEPVPMKVVKDTCELVYDGIVRKHKHAYVTPFRKITVEFRKYGMSMGKGGYHAVIAVDPAVGFSANTIMHELMHCAMFRLGYQVEDHHKLMYDRKWLRGIFWEMVKIRPFFTLFWFKTIYL